jgi:hypothetical protein
LKSKKRRSNRERPLLPETGAWGFAFVSIILLIMVYYSRDYYDIRLGLLGVYLWALAIGLSFCLSLAYYALFILPKRGSDGWQEAVRLLVTFYIHQASRLIGFGKKLESKNPNPNAPEIPYSFTKVKAGIVESHQAAALTADGAFVRASGPGYVKLNKNETVRELVDLRKHLRTMPVAAVTRDGIPIETLVVAIFQLKPLAPNNPSSDQQYWYDEDAIFKALYAGSIDAKQTTRHWAERPASTAAAHLVATLANYTLDEIIQPREPNATPIEDIKSEVKRLASDDLEPQGIHLIAIALSQFSLPDNVAQERVNIWQAEWERQIVAEQATSGAEAWRRIQLARARAQMEMIDSITNSIEMLCRRGDVDIGEIITLRMIETLETAIGDDAVKALLPNHILSSLDQIQEWVAEPPRLIQRQLEE